jgi:polyribonucleotide nucleotidyltransferase
MEKKIFTLPLINGTTLSVEIGRLAQQADGSALVSLGETSVLATTCVTPEPSDVDFLPLTVSYQEKYYAGGLMKHSRVNKREARPSDDNILSARVIDRTVRPLFPKGFSHGVQVMLTLLSYDTINPHDIVSGLGASVSLALSNAPFEGPTSMVRVGRINNQFILNPSEAQRKESDIDLIVSSTEHAIVMIEALSHMVSEQDMLDAMEFGFKEGQKICKFIADIAKEYGKPKIEMQEKQYDSRITPLLEERYGQKVYDAIFDESLTKKERFALFGAIKKESSEILSQELQTEETEVLPSDIVALCDKLIKNTIRKSILTEEKRIKGRKLTEIRDLSSEIDILPRVHGSALFNRGETQALSVVTLAGPEHKLTKTGVEGESLHRYFHHYNFPPYSVGEVSNRLSTGNREIGHGALGEKALLPVLPEEKDFPYSIRVVTEILSSNGSSSMASACGSTLALMAAGVPLKAPVAGIAMGLMTDPETGVYKVLTDLQDEEDFGGDMDFKVAGTAMGITAIQMDIKLKGIPFHIFKEAFEQARVARIQVLESMLAVIPECRKNLSENAPKLVSLQVSVDKIRFIIGKGGETINKIIADTGVTIDINDEGLVTLTSKPGANMEQAIETIKALTFEPEIGGVYLSKVVKLMDFGAFVQLKSGQEGLVHVSQMRKERVSNPADIVKEGEMVQVKLLDIDSQGRFKFSLLVE